MPPWQEMLLIRKDKVIGGSLLMMEDDDDQNILYMMQVAIRRAEEMMQAAEAEINKLMNIYAERPRRVPSATPETLQSSLHHALARGEMCQDNAKCRAPPREFETIPAFT
jgi:hypothetical protein